MARQKLPENKTGVTIGQAMQWAQMRDLHGEVGGWIRHRDGRAIAQGWDALAAFLGAAQAHYEYGSPFGVTLRELWEFRKTISPPGRWNKTWEAREQEAGFDVRVGNG